MPTSGTCFLFGGAAAGRDHTLKWAVLSCPYIICGWALRALQCPHAPPLYIVSFHPAFRKQLQHTHGKQIFLSSECMYR